ncbi:hypothetical protein [Zunongwangia pacifica]|uniref:Uncharacterized protein n=1 Tax=Zunongwangia pacifica TaxID=2911062 RepID=A0A9X1ZWT7_9FLAO|nr:hypothetical protein [Zunongwangia pacifica]MCL6220660.1 hypothetical protein [Zunongwangia pacifica]
MNKFEKAREKFKPKEIKYLLIAETPPKSDSDRFFYFKNVEKQDSLFLETMKVLYPRETELLKAKEIRRKKSEFLKKFKNDGFYLIDSLDQPFEKKYNTTQKIKLIKNGQKVLEEKIQSLLSDKTKVILIAVSVFKANFQFLKNLDIPVINEEAIDFPGSGGQKKFKEKLNRILK